MQSPTRKSPAVSLANSDAEKAVLRKGFETLQTNRYVYKESYLDQEIAEFVKFCCDTLKQDSDVFIMSVDILGEYAEKYDEADPMLIVVSVIFICSKLIGAQTELKVKHLQTFLRNILKNQVSKKKIKQMEVDVRNSLDGKLPLTTKIDDLKTFLQICIVPLNLIVDIQPLCIEILNVLYMSMQDFIDKLNQHYLFNATAQETFRSLFTNKLYLPIGITLSALQLTSCKEFIDLDAVTLELSELTGIHDDHIKLLTEHIIAIIGDTKN